MDTPTAISVLSTLSQNLGAQIGLNQTQQTAVDIAIAQLQGVLDTPSADLVSAQALFQHEKIVRVGLEEKIAEAITLLNDENQPDIAATVASALDVLQ